MAQLSALNQNEVLFTDADKGLTARFAAYTDADCITCMSPEDILEQVETEFNCPLIYLIIR